MTEDPDDEYTAGPTVEDVARRFRSRPGFRLADCAEVGLPVYRLTVQAFVLSRKPISPVEEFILKALNAGLSTEQEIAGFLGLEQQIVHDALVALVQSDDAYLTAPPGSRSQVLDLTQKGRQTLAQAQTVVPEERTFSIDFDALIRKPLPSDWLYKARDLKEEGVREIPPLRKRPEVDELKVKDVERAVRLTVGAIESGRTLLAIRTIERRELFYQKVVTLVYRSVEGDDVQVGFAIDGRMSSEHEEAFAALGGPRKSGIIQELSSTDYAQVPQDAFEELVDAVPPRPEIEALQNAASSAQGELDDARAKAEESETAQERRAAQEQIQSLSDRLAQAEAALESIQIRPIEVYEHAPLLDKALRDSKERLLIISPWIRAKVVNRGFVRRLDEALRRKVRVYVGYGLGENEHRPNPVDLRAEDDLRRLADQYENFTFVRLGDTHAKVLISDRQFMVFTSFNWLSFKGDPNRTFRDEQGLLVAIPEKVDENFTRLVARFASPTA